MFYDVSVMFYDAIMWFVMWYMILFQTITKLSDSDSDGLALIDEAVLNTYVIHFIIWFIYDVIWFFMMLFMMLWYEIWSHDMFYDVYDVF